VAGDDPLWTVSVKPNGHQKASFGNHTRATMMDSERLRNWLEIVGIFSVVASLVFVGLQMRQEHKISLSQAYQSRTTAAAEFNTTFASNPVALSAYAKCIEGRSEEMTVEEYQSLHRMIVAVLHLYDNAYFQYQQGFVSEEFWMVTRNSLKGWMNYSALNTIILDRMNVQGRPEFSALVRSIAEEVREDTDD
jgi:hypothetical protein